MINSYNIIEKGINMVIKGTISRKVIIQILFLFLFILPLILPTSVVITSGNQTLFSITFLFGYLYDDENLASSYTAQELAKLGINADFHVESHMELYTRYNQSPIPTFAEGGYDIHTGISLVDWGELDLISRLHSNEIGLYGWNGLQYNNSEMDLMLENHNQSYTDEDHIYYLNKIQNILHEDLPLIPVIYRAKPHYHNESLGGWDGVLWENGCPYLEESFIPGKTEFHIATSYNYRDLFFYRIDNYPDVYWMNQIYRGLIKRQADNYTWGPSLATSYESNNGINWTFHLDQNASWADGQPLTADDVVFSYQIVLNSSTDAHRYYYYSDFLNNESIIKVDNNTVQFNVKKFDKYVMSLFDLALYPKHIWESVPFENMDQQAADWAYNDVLDSQKIFGAGPYYLEDYDEINKIIHLKKNNYYQNLTFFDEPYFDDIYFHYYYGTATAEEMISDGMDLICPDFTFMHLSPDVPELTKSLISDGYMMHMSVNQLHPILGTGELCPIAGAESAKHVRKAIAHAIPRDIIVSHCYETRAKPAELPLQDILVGYNNSLPHYDYSLEKAREHLIAAGYDVPELSTTVSIGLAFNEIVSIIAFIGGSLILLRKRIKK